MTEKNIVVSYKVFEGKKMGFIFKDHPEMHTNKTGDIEHMTVDDLLVDCLRVHEAGFGGAKVYISQDEEGNGYHELYYGLMTDPDDVKECIESSCTDTLDTENVVLLG